ncbi:MAG: hypothetical protein DRJ05_15520 [Bacteroidetes bacterium]|nr:MAG: hypothetical protein DRJ05_15520 [Bacteroidota bacterium]
MKQIFRYVGMLSGILGGLFILFGVIGRFSGEFLDVRYYFNWFRLAEPFIFFGIFSLMAVLACKDKDDK